MIKILSKYIFSILFFFDNAFKFLTKRSILIWFKEFHENKLYEKVKINKKIVKLFTPNYLTYWLSIDFLKKEPETIEWIDNFKNRKKKVIFWDIGANIGLYSLYSAIKHKNIEIISFEPSTSNLRILSRNISINNLQKKIKIIPLPLTDKEKNFALLSEGQFSEGQSHNSFEKKIDFEGKLFKVKNSYNTFGTSIDYLINQKILETPDYIKIDVDGLEHLILRGGVNTLKNKKIKSIQIEVNLNFKSQFKSINKLMKKLKFKYKCRKRNEKYEIYKEKKFNKIFNFYYIR